MHNSDRLRSTENGFALYSILYPIKLFLNVYSKASQEAGVGVGIGELYLGPLRRKWKPVQRTRLAR